MPDPAIPTEESGTRHRTAQRVARQTGYPVISVSQSMRIISLYVGDRRYVLESSGELLTRANQAIATLERYKARLDEVSNALSALEIEDLVTVRDAAIVLAAAGDGAPHRRRGHRPGRRAGHRRPAARAAARGADGRCRAPTASWSCGTTCRPGGGPAPRARCWTRSSTCPRSSCWTWPTSRGRWACPARPKALDSAVSPRGYRLLARVPRMPGTILDRVVEHFGGLQKLLAASVEDLQNVEGVGENRARTVREAISRHGRGVDHRPLRLTRCPGVSLRPGVIAPRGRLEAARSSGLQEIRNWAAVPACPDRAA